VKAGYGEFALFELGKAHNLTETDEDTLPREVSALSLVCAAEDKIAHSRYGGAAYYQARRYLVDLLIAFAVNDIRMDEPLAGADLKGNPWMIQMAAPFEPGRTALVRDAQGLTWGMVGEYKLSVRQKLKLPAYSAGFELDPLLFACGHGTAYTPLPRFPKVAQDICLRVAADMPYANLEQFVGRQLFAAKPENTHLTTTTIDIYQRPDDQAHKQITFRVSLASYERTLTDNEVSELLDKLAAAAREQLQAERI
ncbi:MAG TPA: hypothetical protein VHC98_00005, partial [Candidatus Saccharimonadales bacterium]|nr:hypothetical protein [Candidatus Saccharimonadales bacterium]